MKCLDDEKPKCPVSIADVQSVTEEVLERYSQELKDFSHAVRSQFQYFTQTSTPKHDASWDALKNGVGLLLQNQSLLEKDDRFAEETHSDNEGV